MPQDAPDVIRLLFATVLLRPYVFVFFAVFLAAGITHLGWRRAVLFTFIGYLVAWSAEYSSIHVGIPFGPYRYITEPTMDKELWVFGVPFMDSLSFVFLAYASYTLALLASTPIVIRGKGLYLGETRKIRRSLRVWLLTGVFFALIDVVIDPIAYHGDKWFLGKIYDYPVPGVYFGVPITNFLGWLLVGLVILKLYQLVDRLLEGTRALPLLAPLHYGWRALLGPALYLGVLLFNLAVTFYVSSVSEGALREELLLLGVVGTFIFLPVMVLIGAGLLDPSRRATPHEIEEHIDDFPDSMLGHLGGGLSR